MKLSIAVTLTSLSVAPLSALYAADPMPPAGFRSLFNGKDLTGWYGLNPHSVAKLEGEKREANLKQQREEFAEHWRVENGELVNLGTGPYATTNDEFGDIELRIEYKTVAKADSGIYLRGTPQVQIWDVNQPSLPDKPDRNPNRGSGGLFNNTPKSPGRDPLVVADKPFGEWNSFRIRQVGNRTWVWLNDKLVVDGAVMENYWDRSKPLAARGPIMLQTHGGEIRWRNIFVREIPTSEALREDLQRRFAEKIDFRFDQPYAGTSNRFQMLDIYLPKQRVDDKPLPVVVFIHGGGWSGGDRKGYAAQAAGLASSGKFAAISVGYRLSGEAKWPAQIYDCKAAIRWIRGHAKELNLDSERIGATGASAGGHLVSLLGLTAGVKELEGDVGEYTSQSSQVTCVVNFCGPTDLAAPLMQGDAAKVDDPAVSGLIGGSLEEKLDTAKAASPLTYVTAKAVPIMTVHGTKDMRVNFSNAEKLDAAMKQAGASSLLVPVTDAGHGIPVGPELAGRIQQFWDLHLRGVNSEISSAPIAAPAPATPSK